MNLGIEVLTQNKKLLSSFNQKAVSLLAHPASVTKDLKHSIDILFDSGLKLSSAFGPQHGMKGEKQYNMEESPDYKDPKYQIPVFSLYGDVRRPTDKMMQSFDTLLIDLQDVGCRIFTYITTVAYMLEACAEYNKSVWILDRPNPAGRPVEGSILRPGWESFVGVAPIMLRHGLTMGEFARWYKSYKQLDLDLNVVKMQDYNIIQSPWPSDIPWVNPSPNIPKPHTCPSYAGTVTLEGTHLSEGRGTTVPLEVLGAPDLPVDKVLSTLYDRFEDWTQGCLLRPCYFQPTFNKFQGELCEGIQIHVDTPKYDPNKFKSYRLMAGLFKSIKQHWHHELWNQFHYEYEKQRSPIDLIAGGVEYREWIDNEDSEPQDLDQFLKQEEQQWLEQRQPFLLY